MPASEQTGPGRLQVGIAGLAIVAIVIHLLIRFVVKPSGTVLGLPLAQIPLVVCLILGGLPLLWELGVKMLRKEFGSDLLAGLSIVTSAWLGEYLAGVLVVLMLSGGEALEAYAIKGASSVLAALAARMPSKAHRKLGSEIAEIPLSDVAIGDSLVVFPHEICPVDGTVVEGRGVMDESFLTGEPYQLAKAPGSTVISGAINGESALTIRADKLAVAIALAAWFLSSDSRRFLAVLVVATPCPLLIAIPVAIIGSISLAARRGIIIKDPAVLEKIDTCRTAIFDKTGTLTHGRPTLDEVIPAPGFDSNEVLTLVASLEQYSKHPLASAILERAKSAQLALREVASVSERPGEGLTGTVDGRTIRVTSRTKLEAQHPGFEAQLPPLAGGLECVALIDDKYAATLRFRDVPRADGASFIQHLGPHHRFDRVMIISGDRESEVRYLAAQVGITEVYAGQSPEQKLELVQAATRRENTVYLGDGINDAPALTAATVGIAFGQNSDITAEAAGAVIMDSSLKKVDEFFHISRRLRAIALQSAVGGMALSLIGMGFAAAGLLPPVAGAIAQEVIDVLAVVNALRVAIPPKSLTDY